MRLPVLTTRAASAAWWSAIEITSRYGVQFVVTVILARVLAPQDFGLVALLLVFTSLAEMLVNGGFGVALIQRQVATDDDTATVFIFSVVSSVMLAMVIFFAAPGIALFYGQPDLLLLTRLSAAVLPLAALGVVPDALLTMRLDFKARARAEVIASLASGAIVVVLALRGFGAISLVVQMVVAAVVRSGMLWVNSGWRRRGRFSVSSFRILFGFGGFMLLSNLLDTIYVRLQSALIGKLYDANTLGLYAIAQSTQQAPASLMSGILMRVGLPVFSGVADEHRKLIGALRLSQRVAMFLFVPCMVGIALVAEPLIRLLYGSRWQGAGPILSVLALSTSVWPMHVLNFSAIGAQGRSKLLFRIAVMQKLVGILMVVCSSPFGPMAIAYATFAATVFMVLVDTYFARRLLQYGLAAQLRDQSGTFLVAGLAALPAWAILHYTAIGFAPMLLSIVVAAATYLSVAYLIGATALSELMSLLRGLASGSRASRFSADEF